MVEPGAPRPSGRVADTAKGIGLYLGPLLFLLAMIVPLPAYGDVEATLQIRTIIGLMGWLAAWWLTEALPLAATALLPLAILPIMQVMPAKEVASNYFQDIIALFFGGFCLALAMQKSGLHRRIALVVLKIFGAAPRRLVLGFMATAAMMSMWVSNTATTLMLLPIALTVVEAVAAETPDDPAFNKRFALLCTLGLAYGASLGGIGTLIGTPPNALFAQFYASHYKAEIAAGALPDITFGRWMVIGLPLVLVLVPTTWFMMTRFVVRLPEHQKGLETEHLLNDVRPKEDMSYSEWAVMLIFFATAIAWITRKEIQLGEFSLPLTGWDKHFYFESAGKTIKPITDATIAMTAAVLLFALPSRREKGDRLLTWDFAQNKLPWSALLLFGGGLALAASFKASGFNEYLQGAFGTLGDIPSIWVAVAVIIGMAALTELTSNTASTAMILPVLATLAAALSTNPLPLLIAGTLGASCSYAMPVATPPNTIVYGAGHVSIRDMVKTGIWLNLLAVAVMLLAIFFLLPLLYK